MKQSQLVNLSYFAKGLQEILDHEKLHLNDVAEKSEVSRQTISTLLQKEKATITVCKKICDGLGLPYEFIASLGMRSGFNNSPVCVGLYNHAKKNLLTTLQYHKNER